VAVQAIRHVVGEEVYLHWILAEGEWLASSPICLTPEEKGTVYSRPQYDVVLLGKFCTAESWGLNTITVFTITANVQQTFSGLLHWSPSLPCSTCVLLPVGMYSFADKGM